MKPKEHSSKTKMESDGTEGTNRAPYSPIRSMTPLCKTPLPLAANREVLDEGDSVVTVEPPSGSEPRGYFLPVTASMAIIPAQPLQSSSMSSVVNTYTTVSTPLPQQTKVQMTMPPVTLPPWTIIRLTNISITYNTPNATIFPPDDPRATTNPSDATTTKPNH